MPVSAKLWQQGLDAQSACNLSGLAHFLVRLLGELRANGINNTDGLNTHHLIRLVVAQMAFLAYGSFDCGTGNHWQRAYQMAEIQTGRHPYHDRQLEHGEKEQILAQWAEEDHRLTP